jgi:hypothetical protein
VALSSVCISDAVNGSKDERTSGEEADGLGALLSLAVTGGEGNP